MKRKKVWTKVVSVAAVVLTSVSSVWNFVSAETLPLCPESKMVEKDLENKFHVKDEEELLNCINKAKDGDTVILESDITLKTNAEIKTSICLDLNGHNILVDDDKENMERQGIIKIRKTNLPYIEKIDKSPNLPPLRTVVKCYVKYDDKLEVTIRNGTIKRANGENGKDGCAASYTLLRNGRDGHTPNPPIKLYCGKLILSNIKIEGGNGGNGGYGFRGRIYLSPFKLKSHLETLRKSNIKGGNGGNGGDGSCAVSYDKHCKIVADEKTQLIEGLPGKGGKGGYFAFSYIIYSSGGRGEDGKDGKVQDEIFTRPEFIMV